MLRKIIQYILTLDCTHDYSEPTMTKVYSRSNRELPIEVRNIIYCKKCGKVVKWKS